MSGSTFRQYINSNKKAVLVYLQGKGYRSTGEIHDKYTGEKDIYQTRKALKELYAEGLIKFKIIGINSKYWALANYKNEQPLTHDDEKINNGYC